MTSDRPMVLHPRVVTRTGGGPEKTIFNSARFLVPYGYDVLCAYMHPPQDRGFGELQKKAQALGAPLVGIPDRGPWDWRTVRQLLAICREHQVAIWHGHDYKSDFLGLLVRRWWPMRLVTTVHGWVDIKPKTLIYNPVDKFCLRFYDKVICVSADLHDECRRWRVPADRCLLIENAIDTQQYARQTPIGEAKRRLGFRTDRTLIGSVARLSEEKNLEGLILAADRLLREGKAIDLIIVGDGPERASLERLLGKLGHGDHIRLLGFRSDTTDLYQAMDMFVLNSDREGLPNVLLEAMALEVPVVATRVGGIPKVSA